MNTIDDLDQQDRDPHPNLVHEPAHRLHEQPAGGQRAARLRRRSLRLRRASILDELKEHSIGEFTISANQTGLTTIIWNLTQAGATLRGMTQVNDRYPDPITGERRMIPAWHLAID